MGTTRHSNYEEIRDEEVFVMSNNELFEQVNRLYHLTGIHICWNFDDKSETAVEFRRGFYMRRERAHKLIDLMEERLRERGVKGKYEIEHGVDLMKQSDYQNAREVLLHRLKDEPDDWYAHFLIGQCYRMQFDFKSSLEHLQTARQLNKCEAKVYSALSETYRSMGENDEFEMASKKAKALRISDIKFN
jgi:tetratricopeptide (TPR) repeat protein